MPRNNVPSQDRLIARQQEYIAKLSKLPGHAQKKNTHKLIPDSLVPQQQRHKPPADQGSTDKTPEFGADQWNKPLVTPALVKRGRVLTS